MRYVVAWVEGKKVTGDERLATHVRGTEHQIRDFSVYQDDQMMSRERGNAKQAVKMDEAACDQ